MSDRSTAVRGDLFLALQELGEDHLITRRELAQLAGVGMSAMHSWFTRHGRSLRPANVPGAAASYRVRDVLAVMAPSHADAA